MAHVQQSAALFNTDHLKQLVDARVAIVHTEWNDKIVATLMEGCERVLHGFGATITDRIATPGSFELSFGCKRLWDYYQSYPLSQKPEAIVVFGAVVRGDTPHFDYVCNAVTNGVTQLNLSLPIPVIFGVLTVDNEKQAWDRLGGTHGHKGEEAAITALKMIHLCRNKPIG